MAPPSHRRKRALVVAVVLAVILLIALLLALTPRSRRTPQPAGDPAHSSSQPAPAEVVAASTAATTSPTLAPGTQPDGGTTEATPRLALLSGQVLDDEGHAVVGARVSVLREDGAPIALPAPIQEGAQPIPTVPAPAWEPAGELGVVRGPIPYPPLAGPSEVAVPGVLSDWVGAFRIELPLATKVIVAAVHPTHLEAHSNVVALRPGETTRVVLRMPAAYTATGRVVNAAGGVVAGAELWVAGALRAVSDAEGRFVLSKLAGPPTVPIPVEVRARGHLPAAGSVLASAMENRLVLGPEASRLEGRVVDAQGFPVAGVQVQATGAAGYQASARSDGSGVFVLSPVSPTAMVLELRDGKHLATRVEDVLAGDDVLVTLDAGGVVLGEARPATGGVLPRGATVELVDGAGTRHRAPVDSMGRFRVTGCAPGEATLTSAPLGYLPVRLDLEVPEAELSSDVVLRDVRLELREAGVAEGRLLDRYGDPVIGAAIEGGGVTAHSDALGRFRLAPVPLGKLDVEARTESGDAYDQVYVERDHPAAVDLRLP